MSNSKISPHLQLLRLQWRIEKNWNRFTRKEKNIYVWDRVPFYKQMWENAASKLSARFIEHAEGIWEISRNDMSTFINLHKVQLDDPVISSLAAHKPFCYSIMRKDNIPVPQYIVFGLHELDKVKRFILENNGYYVIKPAVGTSAGMGVTTHIKSMHECPRAIALASLYGKQILMERLVPGECYRLLILDGKMIHAVRRRGLRMRGDGRSTIRRLIEQDNERRKRSQGNNSHTFIVPGRDMDATLRAQGLSIDSLIEAGKDVLVSSYDSASIKNSEVRTVYDQSVTHLICKDIRERAERVARLLNSRFAGIDVITLDPALPLEESGGVINEINTNPGLHHHYVCGDEDSTPALSVLSYLLKKSHE